MLTKNLLCPAAGRLGEDGSRHEPQHIKMYLYDVLCAIIYVLSCQTLTTAELCALQPLQRPPGWGRPWPAPLNQVSSTSLYPEMPRPQGAGRGPVQDRLLWEEDFGLRLSWGESPPVRRHQPPKWAD